MYATGVGTRNFRQLDPSEELRKTSKMMRSMTSTGMSFVGDYLEWLADELEAGSKDRAALAAHWNA